MKGNKYTEYLEFCSDTPWENHYFEFDAKVSQDSLITTGIEKIDSLGINRTIVEKYKRIKN